MTRLADLFRSGAILDRPCQPFESHVPYLLQFMIDFNLYGCGSVRCRSVRFRCPLPAPDSKDDQTPDSFKNLSDHSLHGHTRLSDRNIPGRATASGQSYARKSRTELEVDLLGDSIMNRDALKQRPIHHDIQTEGQNFADTGERILPSLTELWRDNTRRREALGLHPSQSQLPRSNVRQRSNVWNNEAELKDVLRKVLEENEATSQRPLPGPGRKAGHGQDFAPFPTSFETVQLGCTSHAMLVASYDATHIQPAKASPALKPAPDYKDNFKSQLIHRISDRQSQKLVVVPEDTADTLDVRRSTRVGNANIDDLLHEIKQSNVSQYLTAPVTMRLRGGQDLGCNSDSHCTLQYASLPPTRAQLDDMRLEVVSSEFPEPFYSDIRDVPLLARDYTANGMIPKSLDAPHLQHFFGSRVDPIHTAMIPSRIQYKIVAPTRQRLHSSWQLSVTPVPSLKVVSQIAAPTQVASSARSERTIAGVIEADIPLSVLSIELHAQSRGTLLPNPIHDPVVAIFWAFQDFGLSYAIKEGCIVSEQELPHISSLRKMQPSIAVVDTELDLLQSFIDLVVRLDPDAVLSFEMQNSSLGFLEERSKATFSFSLLNEIGRLNPVEQDEPGYNDRWGETHATSVKISGRHVLNLWRIMRSEMNLLQYTLENVAFHQLHLRIPKYSHTDLHRWLLSTRSGSRQRVLRYYAQRTRLTLQIVDSQGLLSRVSEQARLLGIDFYSVFSRGSQFKVESLMCRIAKPECFMLLSPSKKQVAQQNALECLPLVMEPQSRFYHDPVIVLDFQSLYPSIMIAYNFCYSTCLGKLGYNGLEAKLGVTHYSPDPATLQNLENDIEIAPNGVLYVRDDRRKSLLAKMLHDLLETRAMVKEGMKLCKNDKAAQKLMHNRQLALKLIANVTYGYTSASFSGRMPCADIADSIVQTGRETLEKAIEFIHNHDSWNAEVVYGDTDSLFVKLPSRTKAQAFEIGSQMAREITKMSPSPVKLKFEKVYLPCILLAKKRYVGFKYESPQDIEPVFDAKGIETVRRDGTPAEQKIEEMALKIMFRTGNLSAVKDFFQQECWKIMTGRCSLHDFCFAKEVKLGTYSSKGVPPPGAVISAKSIAADPRSEPQYGERVSYLVISGASRSRLTDRCVPPEELLLNPDLRLDVEYYITKNIIPPLDRLFSLMGVNVRSWYDEMPRSIKALTRVHAVNLIRPSNKIETFLTINHCPVCHVELSKPGICPACLAKPESTFYDLQQASKEMEKTHRNILRICSSCCSIPVHTEVACVSKDCPVYYKRISTERQIEIDSADKVETLFLNQ